MRKMVALVAFAAVTMVSLAASAAPLNIFVRQQANLTDWTVGATAETADNGAIALTISGFTSRTLAALAQISAADSVFQTTSIQIVSIATQTLVPVGQPELVLATLTGPGPYEILNGDDAFGGTAFNIALDTPIEYSLTVVPIPPVPEPATVLLLGLGLAVMATIRRSA